MVEAAEKLRFRTTGESGPPAAPVEEVNATPATAPELSKVETVLEATLRYARERDYTGWDYGDGMSSRILQTLPVDNKLINLAFQETIKRSPVNVRPLFLVEQRRNYKGAALFAMANLNAHRLTGDDRYEADGRELADWLVEHRIPGYSGYCGGHRHQLQHLNRKTDVDDPDVVSTSYGVKALLRCSDLDSEYAEIAATAPEFVLDDLDYTETDDGARIKYFYGCSDDHYTPNAVALGARLFVDLYAEFGDDCLAERATKILDYVVSEQTDCGGWMYRDPPSTSHLSMDNFHNGFIVETLLRYGRVLDDSRYRDAFDRGLSFYRKTLFDSDGAPNWDESNAFPRDVHAAAQGIILFSKVGDFRFAKRIVDWLLDELHAGEGRFYFRKHRFYTRRITLMRWCQAWVAYALSTYLVHARRHH